MSNVLCQSIAGSIKTPVYGGRGGCSMEAMDQFRKHLCKYRYYIGGNLTSVIPRSYWQKRLAFHLARLDAMIPEKRAAIIGRVNYYNKMTSSFAFPRAMNSECQLYISKKSTAYKMDLKNVLRFFPDDINCSYWFGDIVTIPDFPTFLKSRPITAGTENANSVLLKLNRVRHYYVVDDTLSFERKIPGLMWRGKSNQPERVEVLRRFYNNGLCNVGDTHAPGKSTDYVRSFLSIPQQLQYRYILSVEGNDVATNLKWIMASNSLCLMRKPKYETWFMEGQLIPDFHYALIKDDYSDVEEKVNFYNDNPKVALNIIRNANIWVEKFFKEQDELLVELLVMQKYLQLSGQVPVLENLK